MQTIIFMGNSREDISAFPEGARRMMGRQLLRIQSGLDPLDWKPVKTVGPGVREVRIHVDDAFRAFYVTNIGNAIYVLHAFQKKTQETSPKDIAMGRQRFKQIGG
ncbi:MAG: type II toxin-antitoxin system RelE/ParE family toxin [Rudaea sp.]|uniref:type II toxin-antitoxin system RelE/ParE family toxin n=1 Tax=Rudaea sp. TaxID=2136325 RepID=UPI0039E28F24